MTIPAPVPNPIPVRRTRKRTKALTAFLAIWAVAVLLRLLQLQVFDAEQMRARVLDQNQATIDVPAERGAIYDRNGDILAQNIPTLTVYFRPARTETFESKMRTVRGLQSVLELSPADMDRARTALRGGRPLVTLKRGLDIAREADIKNLGIEGLYATLESSRVYPQGPLAPHVLGGVSIDNGGLAGVEYKFDSLLSGTNGTQIALVDARHREYDFEPLTEPRKGKDLVLTIDKTIQYFAQSALERAAAAHGSSWGSAIVSRPDTAEILAMANWPAYDPNAFTSAPDDARPNQAIHHLFDPGSTFKIVTAAAALESHGAALTDVFDCSAGLIASPGSPIRDHERFGILSFSGVIIHSSNVGAVMIGRRVGPGTMYRTIRAFGFGEKTGIGLPAEAAGILHPTEEWSRRSIDSISIGYEISATPLQVLQAVNIVAHRGARLRPRILKSSPEANGDGNGSPVEVLQASITDQIVDILERVVTEGTGQSAGIRGYDIAGKTGTTQLFDPAIGSFSSEKHMATFVGFVPARDPVVSIIVVLDAPRSDAYYGGQVAAPVFREIAARTLLYLGIPPRPAPARSIIAANALPGGRQ